MSLKRGDRTQKNGWGSEMMSLSVCFGQNLCSPLWLILKIFKLEKMQKKKENTWKIKNQNFKTAKTGSKINGEKKERQKGKKK